MAFLLRRSHLGTGHNEDERTSSFSGSERRISRHSSIEGPYRDGTKDTNFPIYCTIENPSAEPRIYARSLLPLGNGFGLNVALGSESRPKLHMSQGAVIGDVGIMDSNGSFEFWFNLFLPPDHPNQPTKTMPPNFSPLHPPLSKEELLTVPDHFPPGTVIASDGVKISRISSSPLKVEFETSAREGAALVLPTGASREDIIDPSRIYPYVKEHAIDWYQGYNGNGEIIAGEPVSNGTVWVITGVDRSTSWAMATFPEDSSNSGKYTRFKYNGENSESVWEDDQRCSPDYQLQNFSDGTQGAIFLRVLAVALSPLEWSGHVTHIPSDCVPHYTVLSTPRVGLRAWVQRAMARILSSTSHASIDTPQVRDSLYLYVSFSPSSLGFLSSVDHSLAYLAPDGMTIAISHIISC
ncbi:hypothetical protein BDZ97DRAFT_836347 [Flammula alnicola]|nr:hypothetical protein BDZ97DRAFT_836347 [Flammula alnicola]